MRLVLRHVHSMLSAWSLLVLLRCLRSRILDRLTTQMIAASASAAVGASRAQIGAYYRFLLPRLEAQALRSQDFPDLSDLRQLS
eukprot:6022678-Pleurochrysis_carterae.AAC.3